MDVPAYRRLTHRLHEPEEFGIAVSGAHLTVEFLARQTVPALIEQVQTPNWALDFYQTEVKARVHAPLPPGWASLGLMRSAAPSTWYGQAATRGGLVCHEPGLAIDGCINPGFSCLAIGVPAASWEKGRLLAGVERTSLGARTAFALPPEGYEHLEQRLQTLERALKRPDLTPQATALVAWDIANFITLMVTKAWELASTAAVPRDSLRNRVRLARRAEAWMREHLGQCVQVPDVCLALRVSRRELEYAFRAAFNESPRDFLQALRLNAIRRALPRTEATVLQVAMEHGVTHPGRFAAHYRAMFGEAPSTGRRSRARWR